MFIEVDKYIIAEKLDAKKIILKYVATGDNVADILTKSLGQTKFDEFFKCYFWGSDVPNPYKVLRNTSDSLSTGNHLLRQYFIRSKMLP